jgi:hypothetical protein
MIGSVVTLANRGDWKRTDELVFLGKYGNLCMSHFDDEEFSFLFRPFVLLKAVD